MNYFKTWMLIAITAFILQSCSQPSDNFPGSEYMPDMAHSVAQEANVYTYYERNTWDDESVVKLYDLALINKPVKGTIPRGYAAVSLSTAASSTYLNGANSFTAIKTPINGYAPFYYGDSEEDRLSAAEEIVENPYPITEIGLERGAKLYNVYCGICHGEKGDGLGYLVNDEKNKNSKYPAAPANFLKDEFLAASNGRFYYTIMYGKNVMGAYNDKLSYEERWDVIHHIRSLQAKSVKAEYSADANTFNSAFGTPEASIVHEVAAPSTDVEEAPAHTEDAHGDDHSNGHH